MARIDWVRMRLENWARWCSQQSNGALGYPRQSTFVNLAARARRAEAVIPTDNIEAAETNEAVESLKMTQSHLYLVLTYVYAKGLPRHLVARRMCRAESTIKRNLEDADHAIALWLHERARNRDRLRAQAEAKAVLRGRIVEGADID